MATENLTIVVNERGARVVKGKLEDIGKGAKQAEGGVKLLRRALGFIGAAAIIRGAIKTADAFTVMQNRIRLVTKSTEELNKVTDDLLGISQRTRSDLGSNVELFNRITLATKDLGTAQSEVLQFTESLNQAVKISGATSTEASAGIIQLSQGLASGALRGDELRSVLEQLPAVADVIAQSLGVTRGRLREMGQEGKITAEVVLRAFREAREELDQKFKNTVGTTSEELIKLRNVVTVAFGKFNEAAGGSRALASAISSITQFVEKSIPAIQNIGRALSGTLDPTDDMTDGMKSFASVIIIVQGALTQLVFFMKNTVGAIFESVGNQIGGTAAAIGLALDGEFALAGETLAQSFGDSRDIIITSALDLREQLIGETTDTIEQLVNVWDEGARTVQDRQNQIFAGADGGGGGGGAVVVDPAVQKLIDGLNELNAELLLQEQAMLQGLQTGEDYNIILERMQTNALAASVDQEGLAFDINETRMAIAALNQEAENKAFLQSLIEQNAAMQVAVATGKDLNVVLEEMALARQFAGDSEGLARALDLSEANRKLAEQLKESDNAVSDFLKRARENAQDILGDALANAFTGGFDNILTEFSQVLLKLASQFLASEIFRLLGQLGQGGAGGGGTGGFLQAIGGFFAGGFAQGGQFQVPGTGGPDSQRVSMDLSPRETVTITPPGQAAPGQGQMAPVVVPPANVNVVNTIEKSEITGAFNDGSGDQVLLNRISAKRGSFRKALGV